MSNVHRVRVGNVLTLQRRQVEVEPTLTYEEIGVRSFGRGIFHKEPVDGAALGNKRVFRIEPGDLVISNVFGWEGAVAVASEAEAGKIGSHRFMTFTPLDGSIDTAWASWFFRSEPGLELIRQASPGSAGRNKTLAVKRFEDLVIQVPPINAQRRVARQLDRTSGLVDELSLRASRASKLAFAFANSCASGQQLPDAEKFRKGWKRVRIGDVLTQSEDRIQVDANGTYPNLGIYSFGRGVFAKPPIDGSRTSATTLWRIRAGQFIYSRLFAFEGAYATVPERFDGYYVSNEFPSFDANEDLLDAAWLAAYVRSPRRWEELATASVGLGVRRQRVPVESILAEEMLLPPIEEQREMMRAITRVEVIRERHEQSTARLAALVPSLLNQEFSAHPG